LKKPTDPLEEEQHRPEDGLSPASQALDASFFSLESASFYYLHHHIQRMLNTASPDRRIAMFHKIMVAYDESPEANRALESAIELTKALHAELLIVTVVEPPPAYYAWAVSAPPAIPWTEDRQRQSALLQANARQLAEAANVRPDTQIVNGDEVDGIINCAKKYRADLLIMGMRQHTWLGHTGTDVAERSPCALMGVPLDKNPSKPTIS
jgi:nucleotide-binding universal stress UspA family protein